MKLIDTTIAVDHLRGEPAAAVLLAELINNGEEIAASELVRFELLAGVRESELAALEAFFSAVVWTLVTEDIARIGGRLARRYRSSHRGIDDVDYLIAATPLWSTPTCSPPMCATSRCSRICSRRTEHSLGHQPWSAMSCSMSSTMRCWPAAAPSSLPRISVNPSSTRLKRSST